MSTGSFRLVVEREIREAFRRRAIWATAAVLMLASTALVVLPDLVGDDEGAQSTVAVVGSDSQRSSLDSVLDELAPTIGREVTVTAIEGSRPARLAVEDGEIDAAVVLTESPTRVIAESAGSDVVMLIRQAVAVADLESALVEAGLSADELAVALAAGDTVVEEIDPVDEGRRATAAIASIVLYVLLLLLTSAVANGVAIEKANRVSEVLLAIVPSRTLLFGKVVGVALVGVVTLSAAALPVVIDVVLGGSLPDGAAATLAGSAAWLLLGVALYLTTAGALGALVDRQEEVGSTIAPLSAVLIAAYFVGVTTPESPVADVLAYIPFTSPMVMPARIALDVASPAELVISLALGVVTVALVARLASVVYQRAIVRTGRKVRLRSLLRSAS